MLCMNKSVCMVNQASFDGPICFDSQSNLPRIYLTLYAATSLSTLAESTQSKVLRDISRFYDFCRVTGHADLDQLLANGEFHKLSQLIEQFYINLLNDPDITYQRVSKIWLSVRSYIDATSNRLLPLLGAKSTLNWPETQLKYENMKAVYMQLRVPKNKPKKLAMRALSAEAVEIVFNIIQPGSEDNPFRARMQKRNYVIVMLMLFLGLRSSECLVLTSNSIEINDGQAYLKITYQADNEDDNRSEKASIKTNWSHRPVILPKHIYALLEDYLATERRHTGQSSSFLFTSNQGKPLSSRQLRYAIARIQDVIIEHKPGALSKNFRPETLSAHDFRHTAACLHLKSYYERSKDMEMALEKLRAFMGWSPSSDMPQKYARLYLQDVANKQAIEALDIRLKQFSAVVV